MGLGKLGKKAPPSDTSPWLVSAGRVTSVQAEGAKECIDSGGAEERPSTPPEIKKYRKSAQNEPGRILQHYGLADDQVVQLDSYGRKSTKSQEDDAGRVIKSYPSSELMQWRLDRQEDVYHSHKREPLGKSMLRGHTLPNSLGAAVPFGSIINAKHRDRNPLSRDLIYPPDAAAESERTRQLYVRSHGDYAPAEQRRRNYEWEKSGVDLDTKVFGTKEHNPVVDGVAKALRPDLDKSHRTTLVPKGIEDFKDVEDTALGKCKSLGHRDRNLPDSHIFGVPARTFDEWRVQRLIQGDYTHAEQAPDKDLGKSRRRGEPYSGADYSRGGAVFGAPSIRSDIARPQNKSVADTQNYGNEPDAGTLLYPGTGAHVQESEYAQMMSKEAMAELFAEAGISFDSLQSTVEGKDAFDHIFESAAELDGVTKDECSISTFRSLMLQMS